MGRRHLCDLDHDNRRAVRLEPGLTESSSGVWVSCLAYEDDANKTHINLLKNGEMGSCP